MKIMGLEIGILGHSSVKIKNNKVVYIDPFQLIDGSKLEKADVILISHEHYDHCSPKDVEKIIKPETIIITVAGCQSKLSNLKVKGIVVLEPKKKIQMDGLRITGIPAYNIGKPFHPKENDWLGFLLDFDGVKVYYAGDTDLIPEMKDIETDIALLPVSGQYVMTALEAAKATKMMKRCRVAIPVHFGSIVGTGNDAEIFKQNAGCEVRIITGLM